MNFNQYQNQVPDSVEQEFVDLIESHQSAMTRRNFQVADTLGHQVLNRAMEAILGEAERGEIDENFLSQVEAIECEERGDWNGALAAYNRALQLAKRESPTFGIWRAHENLASLCYLLGELEESLKHKQLATKAARESDSNVSLRIALMISAARFVRGGGHLILPATLMKYLTSRAFIPGRQSPARWVGLPMHCGRTTTITRLVVHYARPVKSERL
jgi:tetratricopeptide (TPR) repeat protein